MLLHRQPDDVWRVDFQIGWDVDRKEEMKEENIRRRLDAFLGGVEYDMVWSSIYTFQCKRMEQFRHGRVSSLPATPPTRSRPSVPEVPTPACRTSTTSAGNSAS